MRWGVNTQVLVNRLHLDRPYSWRAPGRRPYWVTAAILAFDSARCLPPRRQGVASRGTEKQESWRETKNRLPRQMPLPLADCWPWVQLGLFWLTPAEPTRTAQRRNNTPNPPNPSPPPFIRSIRTVWTAARTLCEKNNTLRFESARFELGYLLKIIIFYPILLEWSNGGLTFHAQVFKSCIKVQGKMNKKTGSIRKIKVMTA